MRKYLSILFVFLLSVWSPALYAAPTAVPSYTSHVDTSDVVTPASVYGSDDFDDCDNQFLLPSSGGIVDIMVVMDDSGSTAYVDDNPVECVQGEAPTETLTLSFSPIGSGAHAVDIVKVFPGPNADSTYGTVSAVSWTLGGTDVKFIPSTDPDHSSVIDDWVVVVDVSAAPGTNTRPPDRINVKVRVKNGSPP